MQRRSDMKKYSLIHLIFIISFTLFGIKCEEITIPPLDGGENGENIAFTGYVMEAASNIPVEGATVEMFACTEYDIEFGCQYSLTHTATTGNNGSYTYWSNWHIERFRVTKPGYWNNFYAGSYAYLIPQAYGKIHLKRNNDHPGSSSISLYFSSDSVHSDFTWLTNMDIRYFNYLPVDTTSSRVYFVASPVVSTHLYGRK